jgi:hypothetical protein
MKKSFILGIGAILVISFMITTASFAAGGSFLPNIPKTWSQIYPSDVDPNFTYNGLKPSCAACPGCDADFSFFVKGGKVNNLVIYFQGGGACWDTINCLYVHTYYEEVPPLAMFSNTAGMGIFDTENPNNPFKDWYIVYIPYCTGDIHWGANDYAYTDDWGKFGGVPQTIRHRGFVNFQLVMKWVKDNFRYPFNIFVTGSSAGGYGAIMGFPYIKQAYPLSKVSVLGDAANGVIGGTFETDSIDNWNIQLPRWIPGFENGYVAGMDMADVYIDIARYYRLSKLAQFTTAQDEDQVFFYNVMANINDPYQWGLCDRFLSPNVCLTCQGPRNYWHDKMLDLVDATADQAPNYRHYIAAGWYHTIMMSPQFYTESSAGVPFVKWVTDMVYNPFGMFGGPLSGMWKNVECTNCEPTCPPPPTPSTP